MKASVEYKCFRFKQPSGTSRGILTEKHAWFITLQENEKQGIGECSIIPGLSPDYKSHETYEDKLNEVVSIIKQQGITEELMLSLQSYPSLLFGVEAALLDLKNGGQRCYFENEFTSGKRKIAINGLVWMGDVSFMQEQIEQKLSQGFTTIKMKVGAIDFENEIKLLTSIRKRFSKEQITLRVDANGAFSMENALSKLQALADLDIHSIEQPIAPGSWNNMHYLCANTPLPIALDEELIGVNQATKKVELLDQINPQFIILKPSLHGGISGTQEWIKLADERQIPWWMTSALESNIGLTCIAQLAGEYQNELPQGLGTGSLYVENMPSKLVVENGFIFTK